MTQTNTLIETLQRLIIEEEVKLVQHNIDYCDSARKFTVYELLKFWVVASAGNWRSFRDSEQQLQTCPSLISADHSTLAKKASEVPYEMFQTLFQRLVKRCGRKVRRQASLPSFALDATTITVGKGRLPWASFREKKSGIKLHVKLDLSNHLPVDVKVSIAKKHESKYLTDFALHGEILIADRGYGSYEDFTELKESGRNFVIRLKNNAVLSDENSLIIEDEDSLKEDSYANIGFGSKRTDARFRVVSFFEHRGKTIRVITNMIMPSAKEIADLYRMRWNIETFFRWIKQKLNITRLFGTTPNAVYGQMYSGLITYFVTQWLYVYGSPQNLCEKLSRTEFFCALQLGTLPKSWLVSIFHALRDLSLERSIYPNFS